MKDRKLVINEPEAEQVRRIFQRFVQLGSATLLARELLKGGMRTKRGAVADKGYIYRILNNRVYLGEAVHKGTAYPGEHQPIVDPALWDKVHAIMGVSPRKRASNTRAQTPALLKGLIFGPTGAAMTPTHTRKRGRLYRYYVSTDALKRDGTACPVRRVPAAEIEAAVVDQIRGLIRAPEMVVATWREIRRQGQSISENAVREALDRFDPLWNELFPAEQTRIVQLLVERIDVDPEGITVRLRTGGLASVVAELRNAHVAATTEKRAA